MDYGFTHDGTVYTPNGTTVAAEENGARNAAIEAAEVRTWAECPDAFMAYYEFPNHPTGTYRGEKSRLPFYPSNTGAHVSTWLGTRIGRITSAKVTRHNFGGRMVSIRVVGTNGATYHGRASWDNGQVIRLRRVKS